MDYTVYPPLGTCFALSLVVGLKATILRLSGTSVLSCLAFPLEIATAGLIDNKGLISSVKGEKGSISRDVSGSAFSAESGETISSSKINPGESEGSTLGLLLKHGCGPASQSLGLTPTRGDYGKPQRPLKLCLGFIQKALVVHAFDPSTWEAEAGGSLSLRPA